MKKYILTLLVVAYIWIDIAICFLLMPVASFISLFYEEGTSPVEKHIDWLDALADKHLKNW